MISMNTEMREMEIPMDGRGIECSTLLGRRHQPECPTSSEISNSKFQIPKKSQASNLKRTVDLLPLMLLPLLAVALRNLFPGWFFMWVLAFAMFLGCKWLTWWQACRGGRHLSLARTLGYFLAWPGMDALAFFVPKPIHPARKVTGWSTHRIGAWNLEFPWSLELGAWSFAITKTITGALILWIAASKALAASSLLTGWIGMLGLILFLHF